jgi:hypothetical protein
MKKPGIKAKTKRTAVRTARSKPRKKKGVMQKIASAAQIVTDSMKEASEMQQKAGTRGGLSEG